LFVDKGWRLTYQVTWTGKDDPENPKNWTFKQKWAATFVVSSFTLISPISSSMVAPALPAIGKDLHITQSIDLQLSFSIFVLAYAVGPLFLGPLSELYGRTIILQTANLIFLVFNTAAGASRNKAEMIAFRFLSGLGGSAPLAVS
jgi:MFS family permease